MPSRDTRFALSLLRALEQSKILGVRSGEEHRFIGVWVVVVEERVFVRSWNDKPTGWYRAFRAAPRGSIQFEGRTIPVRSRHVRSERLRAAVTTALATQYDTKASEKWTRGFAEARREATTLELMPD